MVLIYMNPKIKQSIIPNKGRGFISNDPIDKDEIVLIESPDIFVDKYIESPLFEVIYEIINSNKLDQFNQFVPFAVNNIESRLIKELKNIKNPKVKNKFDKFAKLNDYELSLLIRKYMQNAFNMDNSKVQIKPCILFWGAIFNHSCNPNIDFKFDSNKNQMIFYANKKIGKNIELCDSYIDINLNYEQRQLQLLSRYNFKCDCTKCFNRL